jgi:WD repeat-containing protein 55
MSRDRSLLGSCSHDMTVKFWNIQYLYEEGEGDGEEVEAEEAVPPGKKRTSSVPSSNCRFIRSAGMSREGGESDSEGEDSDADSDGDDKPKASRKKVKKRAKSEKAEKVNRFFADL